MEVAPDMAAAGCPDSSPHADDDDVSYTSQKMELQVVVHNVYERVSESDLADFMSGAVMSAAGVEPDLLCPGDLPPCIACEIDRIAETARLYFTTELATSIAVCLSGIEFRGAELRISRPSAYKIDGPDPAVAVHESIQSESSAISIEALVSSSACERQEETPHVSCLTSHWFDISPDSDVWAQRCGDGASLRPGSQEFSCPDSHYDILAVQRTATYEEIRRAFAAYCWQVHPDRHEDPSKTAEFHRCAEAYRILSHPGRRAVYDRSRLRFEACDGALQYDLRAAAFMLRHRFIRVEEMEIDSGLAERLQKALVGIRSKTGTDILVMPSQGPAAGQAALMMLAGKATNIEKAKVLASDFKEEMSGAKAPKDGLVFIIPDSMQDKLVAFRPNASRISHQTATSLEFFDNRVVIRGLQSAMCANMMNAWFDWKCLILHHDGRTLDNWSLAHEIEMKSRRPLPALVPNCAPDNGIVWRIVCSALYQKTYASVPAAREPLVQLATNALDRIVKNALPLSHTLLKVSVSSAAYDEIAASPFEQQALYLYTLSRVWTQFGIKMPWDRFLLHPYNVAISDLRGLLTSDPRIRQSGFSAIQDVVPDDRQWRGWPQLIKAPNPLVNFLRQVLGSLAERKPSLKLVPDQWAEIPAVASSILVWCCGTDVKVDLDQGLQRAPCAPPPPPPLPQVSSPCAAPVAQAPQQGLSKPAGVSRTTRSISPFRRGKGARLKSRERSSGRRGRSRDRSKSRSKSASRHQRQPSERTASPSKRRRRSRSRSGSKREANDKRSKSTKDPLSTKDVRGLSLVHQVEVVVMHLLEAIPKTYVSHATVLKEARYCMDSMSRERLVRRWFEETPESFTLVAFYKDRPLSRSDANKKHKDDIDWRLGLTAVAKARASDRLKARRKEKQKSNLVNDAEVRLGKGGVDANNLLTCGIAALLLAISEKISKEQQLLDGDLAVDCVKRLEILRAEFPGDETAFAKKVHRDLCPFTPAEVMRAIAAIESVESRGEWSAPALKTLVQCAALDLHDYADLPAAELKAVALTLKVVQRLPFKILLEAEKCVLVTATALRVDVELNHESALSPVGGLFCHFADVCAHLSSILVKCCIPARHRDDIVKSFNKIVPACSSLDDACKTQVFEPEGLSKLMLAIALVMREQRNNRDCESDSTFGVSAMKCLSRCFIMHAIEKAESWTPYHLTLICKGLSITQVPEKELFIHLNAIAVKHLEKGIAWSSDQVLKLFDSAWSLGMHHCTEGFLKALQKAGHLSSHMSSANLPQDIPLLVKMAVLLDSPTLVEGVWNQCNLASHLDAMPLTDVIAILHGWPHRQENWRYLDGIKRELLNSAVLVLCDTQPGVLPVTQVLAVLRVLGDANKAAVEFLQPLKNSLALLGAMPEDDFLATVCENVAALLGPFVTHGIRAQRLESICMAHLLISSEKNGSPKHFKDLCSLVTLLSNSGILQDMPMVVSWLARLPVIDQSALADDCDPTLYDFLRPLLVAAAVEETAALCEDTVLVECLQSLEDVCQEFMGDEWAVTEMTEVFEREKPEAASMARSALGLMWPEALLVRSNQFSWTGGSQVFKEVPNPRCATKDLAEALAGVPLDPMAGLSVGEPENWPPALLVRGLDGQGISETMGGTYVIDAENHGRPVFRRTAPVTDTDVLLYYWEAANDEDACGSAWWFGPEIGSDVVWARHAGITGLEGPPLDGWQLMFEVEDDEDLYFVVVDCSPTGARIVDQSPDAVSSEEVGPEPCAPLLQRESSKAETPKRRKVATPQAKENSKSSPEDLQGFDGDSVACADGVEVACADGVGETLDEVATLKRKRLETQSDREECFKEWLLALDQGGGSLLQYFEVLKAEFDADLTQIAAVKQDGNAQRSVIDSVDPIFWEIAQVKKLGHRMLFARGISKL